jgi:hypothetical protein
MNFDRKTQHARDLKTSSQARRKNIRSQDRTQEAKHIRSRRPRPRPYRRNP